MRVGKSSLISLKIRLGDEQFLFLRLLSQLMRKTSTNIGNSGLICHYLNFSFLMALFVLLMRTVRKAVNP